jgi:hypothetical protein
MPVGQAVMATRVRAASVGLSSTEAAAGVAGAGFAGAGLTTPSTSSTISASDDAARSDATKSLRTSARARLDSSFMCCEPPASGAAMRNARSAGPSGAPKSTLGDRRAKPIVASSTCGERQCGIAMPPGSPVADCASRAIAAAISPSRSVARPASASRSASSRMTDSLSPPASTSSATRSVVMMGMSLLPRSHDGASGLWGYGRADAGVSAYTRTASRSIWSGDGSADPGSAAAALP